jgi:transglutaminase-like putative cysteine protease
VKFNQKKEKKKFSSFNAKLIFTFVCGLVFFIASLAGVASSDLNEKSSLVLETSIIVPINFQFKSSYASLEYLLINYSWIPKNDYRQKLNSYYSTPAGVYEDGVLTIRSTDTNDFELNVKFNTYTTSQRVMVKNKIIFPLKGLNSSLSKYTQATEKIDINDDIRNQAIELASGEDDLYVVVFKLADWVNSNIAYNLSTATSEASLPSSWVLKNRYGVCDELSNLFISMCRSLGIPARFISGIAYTDDPQFDNAWGPHGWVEVYFPEYGWIPFDPTYNQLGYVDATHIKFDEQKEANKDALVYTWLGKNIDISSGEMQINSVVFEEGNVANNDYSISVNFMEDEVSLDSYNVVKATIKNNKNYYVAASLSLARTEGLTTISKEHQDVILLPRETKSVYWIVKVNNLNKRFVYTLPMSVYSFDEEDTEEFHASSTGRRITLRSAENYISQNRVVAEGPNFACNLSNSMVYKNQNITIACHSDTESLWKFCIDDKCETLKFMNITKNITAIEEGFTTVKLTLTSATGGASAYEFLGYNALDEVNVSMLVNATEKVKFGEKGRIIISLEKESSSIPKNLKLYVKGKTFYQEWLFENLEDRKNFELGFVGNSLLNGVNEFNVVLSYSDELGAQKTMEQKAYVELYGLTFFQKIYAWFNGIVSSI